jgi:hypothetical protein
MPHSESVENAGRLFQKQHIPVHPNGKPDHAAEGRVKDWVDFDEGSDELVPLLLT